MKLSEQVIEYLSKLTIPEKDDLIKATKSMANSIDSGNWESLEYKDYTSAIFPLIAMLSGAKVTEAFVWEDGDVILSIKLDNGMELEAFPMICLEDDDEDLVRICGRANVEDCDSDELLEILMSKIGTAGILRRARKHQDFSTSYDNISFVDGKVFTYFLKAVGEASLGIPSAFESSGNKFVPQDQAEKELFEAMGYSPIQDEIEDEGGTIKIVVDGQVVGEFSSIEDAIEAGYIVRD